MRFSPPPAFTPRYAITGLRANLRQQAVHERRFDSTVVRRWRWTGNFGLYPTARPQQSTQHVFNETKVLMPSTQWGREDKMRGDDLLHLRAPLPHVSQPGTKTNSGLPLPRCVAKAFPAEACKAFAPVAWAMQPRGHFATVVVGISAIQTS
jgi:hypothetical protein